VGAPGVDVGERFALPTPWKKEFVQASPQGFGSFAVCFELGQASPHGAVRHIPRRGERVGGGIRAGCGFMEDRLVRQRQLDPHPITPQAQLA
jgi:hypothetical protein